MGRAVALDLEEHMDAMKELFGEVIYSYSRKQAIQDGVLVELSLLFPEETRIYKFPVACTASVWEILNRGAEHKDLKGRVWDLCFMSAKGGIVSRPDPTTVVFDVLIAGHRERLKAVCGPGDNAEPVITVMARHED